MRVPNMQGKEKNERKEDGFQKIILVGYILTFQALIHVIQAYTRTKDC